MKPIGIYPNPDKDINFAGTIKVIDAIAGRAQLLLEQDILNEMPHGFDHSRVTSASRDELFERAGLILVLGGDGTILEAARQCSPHGTPLLGINLGRVGYMAELELDELRLLDKLFIGECPIERRMTLEIDLGRTKTFALNDAVLGSDSLFKMAEIELYCEGKPVNRYRADGLIVSTPTGSTAYNLSAGGAVVDPRMDAIIVTPICSHSLNATPIVFSAYSKLTMKNLSKRSGRLWLSVDGCEQYSLEYGETVEITRSQIGVGFLRLKDGGFYEVLYRKMSERDR